MLEVPSMPNPRAPKPHTRPGRIRRPKGRTIGFYLFPEHEDMLLRIANARHDGNTSGTLQDLITREAKRLRLTGEQPQ